MKSFIVENRDKGEVVIEGHVDEAGRVHIDRSAGSVTPGELEEIVAQIRKDISEGFNGGRLSINGLEWFEPFKR